MRPDRLEREPLVRALDGQELSVLDCTFGMGYDALLLIAAGARVTVLELDPLILAHSVDGLLRYAPELARHLAYRRADHRALLPQLPARSYDIVYLDPMFSAPGTGSNLSAIRGYTSPDRLDPALLKIALRVSRTHVILKLAPREVPLDPPAGACLSIIRSHRQRFACWSPGI